MGFLFNQAICLFERRRQLHAWLFVWIPCIMVSIDKRLYLSSSGSWMPWSARISAETTCRYDFAVVPIMLRGSRPAVSVPHIWHSGRWWEVLGNCPTLGQTWTTELLLCSCHRRMPPVSSGSVVVIAGALPAVRPTYQYPRPLPRPPPSPALARRDR